VPGLEKKAAGRLPAPGWAGPGGWGGVRLKKGPGRGHSISEGRERHNIKPAPLVSKRARPPPTWSCRVQRPPIHDHSGKSTKSWVRRPPPRGHGGRGDAGEPPPLPRTASATRTRSTTSGALLNDPRGREGSPGGKRKEPLAGKPGWMSGPPLQEKIGPQIPMEIDGGENVYVSKLHWKTNN